MTTTRHLLQAHWQRAADAIERAQWRTPEHKAAHAAADCAALHVGLDAMARTQAKRKPQAGCVASYPPIARRPQHEATNCAVAILARHSQRVHDARTFVGDAKASLQATTTALVSVLR